MNHTIARGADFTVTNHGSICLLRALSPACEEWIEEHVGGEETQYFGGAVAVEPRYVAPILEGLEAEGFEQG
jgi:hypothetical protein